MRGNVKRGEGASLHFKIKKLRKDFDGKTQAAVYERAYGWSIIILGYQDKGEDLKSPVLDAEKIVDLEAYGPPQIPKVDVDENKDSPRYGQPEIYTVKQSESEIVSCYYSSIFERIWHF